MPLDEVLIEEHAHTTSFVREQPEVIYPDSDGEPMGETEFHVIATLHLYEALRHFFRNDPNIYVAADMFLYYEEGNPRANKAPDVMVIKGVEKRKRRSFKTWEEHASPCVIFEVTSKSTMVEDMVNKSTLYASWDVHEYFLFDPLHEYLEKPLIGLRLAGKEYVSLQPDSDGFLFSEELGILLGVEDDIVRIINPQTRQPVPALDEAITKAEQEAQRANQEAQRADQEAHRAEQEAQRADQERQRAEVAEAELARLQAIINNS
jgi:Uma2 family endonuclease